MNVRWHEEAKAEVDAAAAFYQDKQPGLALRFIDSLEDALRRIQRHPQVYRQVEGDIRKCRVLHFPYGVIYRVRSGFIEMTIPDKPRSSQQKYRLTAKGKAWLKANAVGKGS